ncbi:MAG TPA: hypothetical protein VMH24_02025 [Candidatus Sulfotelmatobacter sp.]|nr:hypothetical protein [Candidatus Sulfotelmatobacter sp.]
MTDRAAGPTAATPTTAGRPGTAAARADVAAARAALGDQLGSLESTVRETFTPANLVRHNAGKLAAGAGAAGFVALGGPSRILKGAGRALRRGRKPAVKSLLPKEIDDAVRGLGPDEPAVRASLERGFADYLRGRQADEPSANRSLWRLVDAISVPVARRVVREATQRFLDGEGSGEGRGTPPA